MRREVFGLAEMSLLRSGCCADVLARHPALHEPRSEAGSIAGQLTRSVGATPAGVSFEDVVALGAVRACEISSAGSERGAQLSMILRQSRELSPSDQEAPRGHRPCPLPWRAARFVVSARSRLAAATTA